MFRWFFAEYRRHPVWAALLLVLLAVGLALDFLLISEPPPSSPISGVSPP